ncbi:MAG: hypothetical protein JNJ54_14115 [Myxococcaceae bacterium]|nr:hypothetical protein [Myxococcaceae bacterium]
MNVFRLTLVLCCAIAAPAAAQGLPTGPSDDPAPAEATTATRTLISDTPLATAPDAGVSPDGGVAPRGSADKDKDKDRPRGSQGFVEARGAGGEARFGGFDFGLTTFFSSGLFFAPESYTASLTFWLEPSWRFGAKLLPGTWFESMLLAVRLPVEVELTGSDARFRGASYVPGSFFNTQEGLAALSPQVGVVDGTARQPVILGDTWISLIQGKTLTIPVVGITLANSLRLALPTSLSSRNTGFISSLSLGFIFDKTLGPVHLTWVFRPAKYFYESAVSSKSRAPSTFMLNGRTETTAPPMTTGVANPDFGFINGLSTSVELPLGFSVSASYFLFNIMPYPLAPCVVAGVPQADCSEQPKFGGSQWRNDHWFLFSVDWAKGPVSLSLGLSTYRPINQPDGKPSQPFLEINRSNASTLYLSFTTSAEQLVDSLAPEKKK